MRTLLLAMLLCLPLANAVTTPLVLEVEDVFRITEASLGSTKVTPTAGAGANITLRVRTSDPATVVALFLDQVIELDGSDVFEAALHLSYAMPPGNYSIELMASNGEETVSQVLTFVYAPLAAVLLDIPELRFGRLVPGETTLVEGDSDLSTAKPTIYNAGNVPVNLAISAETPYAGEEKIALANVQFAIGNDDYGPLKTATQVKNVSLKPGEALPLNLKISVPYASSGGTYVGALRITAR